MFISSEKAAFASLHFKAKARERMMNQTVEYVYPIIAPFSSSFLDRKGEQFEGILPGRYQQIELYRNV